MDDDEADELAESSDCLEDTFEALIRDGDGFTGECVECGKQLHPDEYEAEVCDDCLAKLETE
jgi:hypothetical protein